MRACRVLTGASRFIASRRDRFGCGVAGMAFHDRSSLWILASGAISKTICCVMIHSLNVDYYSQPGDPGYSPYVLHGLIASTSDMSTGISTSIQWNNGTNTTTGATGTAIGTGSANTAAIIASQGAGVNAPTICAYYTGGGFTDWYLPSRDELNTLYINRVAIGGFNSGISSYYWSSTELTTNNALIQLFTSGSCPSPTRTPHSSCVQLGLFNSSTI